MTDYMVLQDGPATLNSHPSGTDRVMIDFDLPRNFTVGVRFGKPVLAYIINPQSRSSKVGGWVNPVADPFVSSEQVISLNWTTDNHSDYGLWEAVDGRKFKAGESNRIVFKAWEGKVIVRDIILWFQRGSGN
ncbi:hypothetical protein ACJ5NV_17690 [Loktanella agnita]